MRTLSRKLQKLPSNGSFLLTLPKDWCELNKLEAGAELSIAVDAMGEGTLLVSLPQLKDDEERVAHLKFGNYRASSALSRAILSRYLEGYEIINITGIPTNDTVRYETEELVDSLLSKLDGCSANKLEHRFELTIAKEQEKSPKEVLHHLYDITREMLERSTTLLFDFKEVNAKILIKRENESDKLYFSIVRSLKKMLQNPFVSLSDTEFDLVDTLEYRMVASNLENLSDAAESIAEGMINYINDSNESPSTHLDPQYVNNLDNSAQHMIRDLGETIHETLQLAFDCFDAKDEKLAISLGLNRDELKGQLHQLRRMDVHPLILSLFEEGAECIVDILELVGE